MSTDIIKSFIVKPLWVILGVSAFFGVAIHDTGIDKFTAVSFNNYTEIDHTKVKAEPHTHSEKSASNHLLRSMANGNPKINPKSDRKHTLHLKSARYGLPANALYHQYV